MVPLADTDAPRVYDRFPAARRAPRLSRSAARAWLQVTGDSFKDDETVAAGRRYGLRGLVGPIALQPGEVFARSTDDDEVAVRLHVTPLTDEDWSALERHVAQSGAAQARLGSNDLDPHLLDGSLGPKLTPSLDEVSVACECSQGSLGCVHAVALACQVAWLLEQDPTALVELRGGSVGRLLTARSGTERAFRARDDADTDPVQAFAAWRPTLPLELPRRRPAALFWLDAGHDDRVVDGLLAGLAAMAKDAADALVR